MHDGPMCFMCLGLYCTCLTSSEMSSGCGCEGLWSPRRWQQSHKAMYPPHRQFSWGPVRVDLGDPMQFLHVSGCPDCSVGSCGWISIVHLEISSTRFVWHKHLNVDHRITEELTLEKTLQIIKSIHSSYNHVHLYTISLSTTSVFFLNTSEDGVFTAWTTQISESGVEV